MLKQFELDEDEEIISGVTKDRFLFHIHKEKSIFIIENHNLKILTVNISSINQIILDYENSEHFALITDKNNV